MTPWLAALAVAAQVSSFDVASVKPVNPLAGPHVVSLIVNHERLNIVAAELRQIVGLAYAIQRVRVQGGPAWSDSDQFDIAAKAASPDATRDEIRAMLQTLLAERFKLVTHRETKQLASYSIVLAKSALELKESPADRKPAIADTASPGGKTQTVFEAEPLRVLVNMLANTIGSPVVDKTGLTGLYDYSFEWPDSSSSLVDSIAQLGLKLEVKKEPVEVLMIDHAEKPASN